MLDYFLAGTAYMHPFTMQAAWNILLSFHFTLWSLSLVFIEVSIPLCTTRLFKLFSLENNLYVWMSLNIQAQDCVLQAWPAIPIELGKLQCLACTSGSGIFWVPMNLLQAMEDSISSRLEVPLSSWLLVWLTRVWAAAPHFLQSIWSCSAGQDANLSRNAKQTRVEQTWEVRMWG